MVLHICANAQCSSTISTFPFTEDFEATNGGWIIRGNNSDWEWGRPEKSIINSAYSGNNAWVVGGLTGGSYNGNEASWIQSPCYDLSSLQKPLITFNIIWESESGWDGTGFQYSLDNGSSWKDVGSIVDPKDCLNENWFNTSSVRFLQGLMQSANGWTGSSGGWVTAKKAIPALVGKTNVIFRFVFASGSQQNNYEGVAIDDFGVSEAPAAMSLTSTIITPIKCNGNNNGEVTVNATGAAGPFSYSWNTNPVQTDATATNLSAGTYTVTVSAPNVCTEKLSVTLSAPAALAHTVTSINPGCVATTGSINITETGGTGPYTFSWSPNVSNTSSATGLTAGTYNITVTDNSLCTDIFFVEIINVIPPNVMIESKTDVICNGEQNGTATAAVTGGVDPITYSWNTNPVQTTINAINLKAGNYIFTVKDGNGCTSIAAVTINEPPKTTVTYSSNNTTCNLPNGSINLFPSGSTSTYQYTWSPSVSTNAIASNIKAGRYAIELKDNAGCITAIPEIRIVNTGTPTKIFLGKDTTICTGEKVILSPAVQGNYVWQDNSTAATFSADRTGKYWVQLTNNDACISSDTILVNVVQNCVDIYFPSVFSPNGDGLNEQYGPVGNLNAVSNYTLSIYNRWGELMFTTNDPRKRWNGNLNGKLTANASFTWFASYIFGASGQKLKKGVLVIIR